MAADSPDGDAEISPRPRAGRWKIPIIGVGVLLLTTVGALAMFMVWQATTAGEHIRAHWEARMAANGMFESLLNAETGQRGYMLTHDPAYLEPYNEASDAFQTYVSRLRAHVASDSRLTDIAEEMARTGAAKLDELRPTIELTRANDFEGALKIVAAGHGKATMDEFRAEFGHLSGALDRGIARITSARRTTSTLLVAAMLAVLTVAFVLTFLHLNDARRDISRLLGRDVNLRHIATNLEQELAARNRLLTEVNQRFDVALRASGVTVMTQDRDLVFTWISRGAMGLTAQAVMGKSEAEVTPEDSAGPVVALKRRVLETGEPARGDIKVAHRGKEVWYDLSVHPLLDEHGHTAGIIAGAIDVTRYKEQEAHIRLLMRELTHRSKNLLAVVGAIGRQTLANSSSLADFGERFSARIQALGGSHDLLVQDSWHGASLRPLVRSQLGHYSDLVGSQIELTGEDLRIAPDAAQHIGMALHELATNAAKYGALSCPDGKVRIAWSVTNRSETESNCTISWTESNGPPVSRPGRAGFGRVVIERTVARAVRGEVAMEYLPSGVKWTLTFPIMPVEKRDTLRPREL